MALWADNKAASKEPEDGNDGRSPTVTAAVLVVLLFAVLLAAVPPEDFGCLLFDVPEADGDDEADGPEDVAVIDLTARDGLASALAPAAEAGFLKGCSMIGLFDTNG